jgi:hypothetical protein
MDTRTLGYVGLGILVGIVLATLIGIPPFIWITAAIVALCVTAAVALGLVDGTSDAARMLGLTPADPAPSWEPEPPLPERTSDVHMEVVRPAALGERVPAAWRVHRYERDGVWVVERVSTKDPDNPRKRVIGETLTFMTEADATAAADELAQGRTPSTPFPERQNLTPAEA